jgi:hypothetical protein
VDNRKDIKFPFLHLLYGTHHLRTKQLNESCFYCSVPGCNGARSRASNPRWLRASLLGKCEATRDIPTACGRKYAICSRVRPIGRRNRATLSVFDTWVFPFYQSLALRNQMLWLSRQRSRDPSRARIHRRRVGNKNLRREMNNSPIEAFSFLLIRLSSSAVEQFICHNVKYAFDAKSILKMIYVLYRNESSSRFGRTVVA